MSPASILSSHPPTKRRRKNVTDEDPYVDIQDLQDAQLGSDSLSLPSTKAALNILITEQSFSDDQHKEAERILHEVKDSLDRIPKQPKKVAFDSSLLRNTFRIAARGSSPHKLFRSDGYQDLSIQCVRPTRVRVIGGFLLGYPSSVLDVAIGMPSDIFQKRDYLNYRYHDKRLLYLTYIARHFVKTEKDMWENVSLTSSCLNGEISKPVLTLASPKNPGITIRLIPMYTDEIFAKDYLSADRKNVREHGESSVVKNKAEGTILYNNSILIDGALEQTLKFLHSTLSTMSHLKDTMLLLNAWRIRHRLLPSNFYFAAALVTIVRRSLAPSRGSPEHLLRCTFSALRGGILGSLVICGLQIGASLEEATRQRVAGAAGVALRVIESRGMAEDPWYGVVPYLFATARGTKCGARPLGTLFDGFIKISRTDDLALRYESISAVLRQSLIPTKRLTRLENIREGLFGFNITSLADACRKVDTRPSSWEKSSFESFWGSKSTLRRFKDGKIVEALVWSGGVSALSEIVSYVIEKHIGKEVASKVVFADIDIAAGISQADAVSSLAISTFNKLASELRSLEGLPLNILGVHATSTHLRRCGAYAIRPNAQNKYVQSLSIVTSFESSGAWPSDPVAISAAKAAFYVSLKSKLGERGINSQATISFLDIQLGEFIFRLRIRVDKEKDVLSSRVEEAEELTWVTETLVRHHDNMREVNSPIMGSLAKLAKRWFNSHMLMSQMGDRAEELIEVLAASVLSQSIAPLPKSSFSAFCQLLHMLAEFPWEICPLTVLLGAIQLSPEEEKLEDETDRRDQDLSELRSSAQKRMSQSSHTMAVYCELDNQGEALSWFQKSHAVELVVVRRIRETARASMEFIENFLLNNGPGMFETIFTSPTGGFNAILELDAQNIPFCHQSAHGAIRSRIKSTSLHTLLVDFDPTEKLLEQLRERFAKYAMFWVRRFGGSEVFILWRPIVRKVVNFSLREVPFRVPEHTENRDQLAFSTEQILTEIRSLGGDFITDVRFAEKLLS